MILYSENEIKFFRSICNLQISKDLDLISFKDLYCAIKKDIASHFSDFPDKLHANFLRRVRKSKNVNELNYFLIISGISRVFFLPVVIVLGTVISGTALESLITRNLRFKL